MKTMEFDDFEVGQVFDSPARTVTETDLSMMCMLSGDWHPLHSDEEFARATPFGRRVVSGMFGPVLAGGFMSRLGIFEESARAMLDLAEWRFAGPIFVGDTLRMRMTIAGRRETSSREGGVLERRLELINQRGEVVQHGISHLLMRRRPPEGVTKKT